MSAPQTLAPEPLRRWIGQVLVVRGMADEDAALVAEALVDTSLRGVDTHGIGLLPNYADLLEKGVTKPRPAVAIEERGAFLKVEADCGLGQAVVARVLDRAIGIAREKGSATAAIGHVGHLGALGWFARRAAERGMVSLIVQNGPPLMGLSGSTARAIGNNPIAFGLPLAGRPPVIFDVATSEAAYGKLLSAAAGGEPIPDGWALDNAGRSTRDPRAAMEGILLPAGGAKGIGLAMLVEALAGSLTGTRADRNIFGAFLMVVDPAAGDAGFGNHIAGWLDHYAASGPEARYPGQRAETVHRQRSRDGIPVGDDLRTRLAEVAERTGVPLPEETR